jgi:hypothetical protein
MDPGLEFKPHYDRNANLEARKGVWHCLKYIKNRVRKQAISLDRLKGGTDQQPISTEKEDGPADPHRKAADREILVCTLPIAFAQDSDLDMTHPLLMQDHLDELVKIRAAAQRTSKKSRSVSPSGGQCALPSLSC